VTIPDRAHIATEQRNPRTMDLHRLSVEGCVRALCREDAAVITAIERAGDAIAAFIRGVEPGFLAGGRLVYVGAGTSGRLGVLDSSEIPPTFHLPPGRIIGVIAGGDPALRVSSEGKEDDPDGARPDLSALGLTDRDAVLGIAAGGTTPYVHGALAFAKSCSPGCVTGLLSCSALASPASHVDFPIVLDTGPEALTGSTRMKAGTATKLALNTISTTLMIRSGRVYENLMVDMKATNQKLRDRAARIVSTLTALPRDEAFALLDRAGGAVKTAVVMHRLRLNRPEAEARLEHAQGRLDRALGE
jgi:N-acetylmuramic acid 6-phosphate etherase